MKKSEKFVKNFISLIFIVKLQSLLCEKISYNFSKMLDLISIGKILAEFYKMVYTGIIIFWFILGFTCFSFLFNESEIEGNITISYRSGTVWISKRKFFQIKYYKIKLILPEIHFSFLCWNCFYPILCISSQSCNEF